MISPQHQLFASNLPKRPYCTDYKGQGLIIRSTEAALGKRYVQHNHPNSKLWLAFDVDRATSPDEICDDLLLPPPNLFVQNPVNGHAHVLYSLEVPVHVNTGSSTKTIRFAGAVDCGLSTSMRADPGYSGLITKNPLHQDWRSVQCAPLPYSLGELSDYVDLATFNDKRKNLPGIGLGRNCTLFDRAREWAYKNRLDFDEWCAWQLAVMDRVQRYNDFTSPLPVNEVRSIARSIAKWTWARITKSQFAAIQAHRGRQSGVARRKQSAFKRTRAMQLIADGYTQRRVADQMGVTERQVRNWVKAQTGNEPYQIVAPQGEIAL